MTDEVEKQHPKRKSPKWIFHFIWLLLKLRVSSDVIQAHKKYLIESKTTTATPNTISCGMKEFFVCRVLFMYVRRRKKNRVSMEFAFSNVLQFKNSSKRTFASMFVRKKIDVWYQWKQEKRKIPAVSCTFKAQLFGWRMIFCLSTFKTSFVFIISLLPYSHIHTFSSNRNASTVICKNHSIYHIYEKVGVNFRFLCLVLVIHTDLMSFFMGRVEKRFARCWRCNYISCVREI